MDPLAYRCSVPDGCTGFYRLLARINSVRTHILFTSLRVGKVG